MAINFSTPTLLLQYLGQMSSFKTSFYFLIFYFIYLFQLCIYMFWGYEFVHINVIQYLQIQKRKSVPLNLELQAATLYGDRKQNSGLLQEEYETSTA